MTTPKDSSDNSQTPDAESILISILIMMPFVFFMLYLLLRKKQGAPVQPLPNRTVERWKNWRPVDD